MHTNPIDIEQRFQKVLLFLSQQASARQRLEVLDRFLAALHDDPRRNADYIQELAQYIPELAGSLKYTGILPDFLHNFLFRIRHFQDCLPELKSVSGLDSSLDTLEQMVDRLQTFAGENPDVKSIDRKSAHKSFDNLQPTKSSDGFTTVVPVIEIPPIELEGAEENGSLRQIGMRIWRKSGDDKDHLDCQAVVAAGEETSANFLDVPIQASRSLLAENHPQLKNKFLAGQVTFEAPHAVHKGCSANLALAALFYCATLEFFNLREQFYLKPNTAITGNVDAEGRVLPVDENSLARKVEAVFFSWLDCLVVPQQQTETAKTALAALLAKYPNRKLSLIGVSHLKEIFYDRRITACEKLRTLEYTTRKLWREHRAKVAVSTILILLAIIGKLWYEPLDKNPVAAEFAGESLLIKNKSGEIVDKIWVGSATVRRAKDTGYDNELMGLHYVAFFDVDGDSINEVFWVQWTDETTGQSGKIRCKSVREDTVRWTISLRHTLDFPRKPDVTSDHFYPNQIAVGDFDGDGRGELFVNCTHDFFPSLVVKLEAETGKELGHYVHIGHLPSMKLVDLDNDGITEVLLCGVNNAFRKACLVVLDPRFISGHSPLTGDYVIDGYPAGQEKAYILIPETIVGKAFAEESKNNNALALVLQPASRNFYVLIRDFTVFEPPLDSKLAVLFAYFGFDLQPQGFGTSDSYDLVAEKLLREGRISRIPDFAYFEEYKKTMLYWNGDGFKPR